MKLKKITGWCLLLAGLLIIFYSLYFSYKIFTGKSEAPVIFKPKELEFPKIEKSFKIDSHQLEKEIESIIKQQIKELIPAEFLSTLLNLISWSIFSGILIFGGSRISLIGVKLITKEY